MTLIELIVLALWLGCAALTGVVVGGRFGVIAGLLGSGLILAMPKLVSSGFRLATGGRTRLPLCRNGSCHEGDYRAVRGLSDGTIVRCGCGDRYLFLHKRPRGRTVFARLGDDNSASPYMSHSRFGPWIEDRETDLSGLDSSYR
jgi:hypothetical protein